MSLIIRVKQIKIIMRYQYSLWQVVMKEIEIFKRKEERNKRKGGTEWGEVKGGTEWGEVSIDKDVGKKEALGIAGEIRIAIEIECTNGTTVF